LRFERLETVRRIENASPRLMPQRSASGDFACSISALRPTRPERQEISFIDVRADPIASGRPARTGRCG